MTDVWVRAYLVAWLFWMTLAMGCWGWKLIHNLTGGNWGRPLRSLFEGGAATFLPLALAFLPVALALPELYPWARPAEVAADSQLQHKQPYLNVPFFLARTTAYFAVWIGTGWFVRRAEDQALKTGSAVALARLNGWSAFSLLLTFLTVSFAAIDWCMSLEPHFTSVAYGVVFLLSLSLAGLAFAIAAENGIVGEPGDQGADLLNDQGNLLLAFVMLWAYTSFCQFLIIWYSNLPEEAAWYSRRLAGGWQAAALALVGLKFALPFALLLSRDVKRSSSRLGLLAAGLLAMHWLEIVWLVEPAFDGSRVSELWRDMLATAALGTVWMAVFRRHVKYEH